MIKEKTFVLLLTFSTDLESTLCFSEWKALTTEVLLGAKEKPGGQ